MSGDTRYKIRIIGFGQENNPEVRERAEELARLLTEYGWFEVVIGSGEESAGIFDIVIAGTDESGRVFASLDKGKTQIREGDVGVLAVKLYQIFFERFKALVAAEREKKRQQLASQEKQK